MSNGLKRIAFFRWALTMLVFSSAAFSAFADVTVTGSVDPVPSPNGVIEFFARDLVVGSTAMGSVTVDSGSELRVSEPLRVGVGGLGELRAVGADTQVNGQQLLVGDGAVGVVEIADGARLNTGFSAVGLGEEDRIGQISDGTLRVTGQDSIWGSSADWVGVGNEAGVTGRLEITDGGLAFAKNFFVGNGGRGEVRVDGVGSELDAINTIPLGGSIGVSGGSGVMSITGGGTANSWRWNVGMAGGTGMLTVSGVGSTAEIEGSMGVGFGTGDTVSVSDGGKIRLIDGFQASLRVGYNDGFLEVDSGGSIEGTGRRDEVRIAEFGSGRVLVGAGGSIDVSRVEVGESDTGVLDVQGPGAQVGVAGSGVLAIFSNGVVTVKEGGTVNLFQIGIGGGRLEAEGEIEVDNLINDGTVDVIGAAGRLKVKGRLENREAGGRLVFDAGSIGNDKLTITGTAELEGVLELRPEADAFGVYEAITLAEVEGGIIDRALSL